MAKAMIQNLNEQPVNERDNTALPGGVASDFAAGGFDCGVESGFGELHGSRPFVMSYCKIMIAATVNTLKRILAAPTRIYLDYGRGLTVGL